jgi:hypothetical protein
MINAAFLAVFFALALYTLSKNIITYRREPHSEEARYLLGSGASVIFAAILGVMSLVAIDAKVPWVTNPIWVRIVRHAIFSLAVIGIIYNGVGFAVVLIGLDRQKIRRCAQVFATAFIIKTILEILYRIIGVPIRWYGLILFSVCLAYMLRMIFWFHVHAKDAIPTTKWRMGFAKWGMILCLFAPLDWWLLQPITASWVIRPCIVLAVLGWSMFVLPSTMPPGFQRLAFLIEVEPSLLLQNTYLLSIVADLLHTSASRHIEPLLRKFTTTLRFPPLQTEFLVRAAYLRILQSNREQISKHLAVEMLYGQDVEPILRHFDERWDGKGKPRGLLGESIPLESRILTLIFAFTNELEAEENPQTAIAQIRKEAGGRFDPRLVAEFERVVDSAFANPQ